MGLWAAGAGVITSTGSSPGPFSDACNSANGYFSTWVAFFASAYYAYHSWVGFGEDQDGSAAMPSGGGQKYEPVP